MDTGRTTYYSTDGKNWTAGSGAGSNGLYGAAYMPAQRTLMVYDNGWQPVH